MSLAVLGADTAAGSAANTSASMVHHHDHAIELTIEVVVSAVAGAEDFTRVIYAVKVHDLARADLETAAAADTDLDIYSGQILRHPCRAVAGDECAPHRKIFIFASSLLAPCNSA
ncbi:conserved hypothetical protein [Mesorhizobium ventifaucium]|uniref:Uncharacterized protein n=1 Tax=Mesorhizobium ventifaucium TaxID=666020 RepID=A0ABN8J847_9HYPH|nr:conserved hypothetical protein [Mesorhizobium ventifaucium]